MTHGYFMVRRVLHISTSSHYHKILKMENKKITDSDLVWAKQKYSAYWPARVS